MCPEKVIEQILPVAQHLKTQANRLSQSIPTRSKASTKSMAARRPNELS